MTATWLWLWLACGGATPAETPEVPAPAPAPAPEAAARTTTAPLVNEVRLLGGALANGPLPTIVAAHGLGSTAERFIRAFKGYPTPAQLIVVQAPYPFRDGASWFPDDARGDEAAMADALREAAERLLATLDVVDDDHPIAGKPVVTGFSQGGMVSFAVALTHPEAIAGAVPVAGWLPRGLVPDTAPAGAVRIRALHGDADPILPLTATRRGVDALRAAGLDVELEVFPGVKHVIPDEVRTAWFRELAAMLPPMPSASP